MIRSQRFKFALLVVVAAFLICGAGAWAANTPAAAIKAYFAAVAKGDIKTFKALSTARHFATSPHRPGTAIFRFYQAYAAAFRAVGRVRIQGDSAVAVVHFTKAGLARALKLAAAYHAGRIKDRARRQAGMARFRARLPGMIKSMSSAKMWLVNTGRGWIVQRLKGNK